MGTFIKHIQDIVRENEITGDKFMAGVELVGTLTIQSRRIVVSNLPQINESGHMSASLRNEGQLLCDVIGLKALVDDITHAISDSTSAPTTTSCLGLFWHPAPERKIGTSIVHGIPDGDHTLCMVR